MSLENGIWCAFEEEDGGWYYEFYEFEECLVEGWASTEALVHLLFGAFANSRKN